MFDAKASDGAVGVTALLHKGRIVLIADTLVHEWPEAEDLADIAIKSARVARNLGLEPRVAFVSFSTFGYPVSERAAKMGEASRVLDGMKVDFEYEGEMTVDVALNKTAWRNIPSAGSRVLPISSWFRRGTRRRSRSSSCRRWRGRP